MATPVDNAANVTDAATAAGGGGQLQCDVWTGCSTQERDQRVDEHAQGVAVSTHQEPVPDQG